MERLCCVVTNTKINFLIQCYIYFSVLATVYWNSDNESNCVLVENEFVRLLLENQFLQDYTNSIKPCTHSYYGQKLWRQRDIFRLCHILWGIACEHQTGSQQRPVNILPSFVFPVRGTVQWRHISDYATARIPKENMRFMVGSRRTVTNRMNRSKATRSACCT